jgi:hypothetical protein
LKSLFSSPLHAIFSSSTSPRQTFTALEIRQRLQLSFAANRAQLKLLVKSVAWRKVCDWPDGWSFIRTMEPNVAANTKEDDRKHSPWHYCKRLKPRMATSAAHTHP